MDKRFNYDSGDKASRQQNVVQAAIEMEEALFLQRQQELQRDIQLQRLLLQEQIEQRNALAAAAPSSGAGMGSAPAASRSIYDIQYRAAGLAAQYEQELLLQREQLRRQQLVQAAMNARQQHQQQSAADSPTPLQMETMLTTAANSTQEEQDDQKPKARKRSFDSDPPQSNKRGRSESIGSERANVMSLLPQDIDKKRADAAMAMVASSGSSRPPPLSPSKVSFSQDAPFKSLASLEESGMSSTREMMLFSPPAAPETFYRPGVLETLATVATDLPARRENDEKKKSATDGNDANNNDGDDDDPKGNLQSLISAAKTESAVDDVVQTLVGLKTDSAVKDLLEDDEEYDEETKIELPGFKSILPRLPREPEYVELSQEQDYNNGDDDDNDATMDDYDHEDDEEHNDGVESRRKKKRGSYYVFRDESKKRSLENGGGRTALQMTVDYPYVVDAWWPSIGVIRKERRHRGDESDEDDFVEPPSLTAEKDPSLPSSTSSSSYRINLAAIRNRLAKDLEPGVLEKLSHCRVHRMFMKQQRVANAPDHAFCWQVTENYCNQPMVCCSICSTWRHAACGGHYKPLTVKEMIESSPCFQAICDRCIVEDPIVQDFERAKGRLERQRIEHLRRGQTTSAVMRQAAFTKHGGTSHYKWPLGSVAASHMGGHLRSVHSRHDKAEKQWAEMATRLSKGYGYRPKERIKVRTRELERLLIHVEDAEDANDRHNMILFLQDDTRRCHPVGYEKPRRNIFDPAEYAGYSVVSEAPAEEPDETTIVLGRKVIKKTGSTGGSTLDHHPQVCIRSGCNQKARFDSQFCSDGCGVAALESDLLDSFHFASEIHPSLLRNWIRLKSSSPNTRN